MASLSTTSTPLTQVNLIIAALIESLEPKPELYDQNKYDLIKTVLIPNLARFAVEHPRGVIALGACSAMNFDSGERFRPARCFHHVLQEYVDCSVYPDELFGEAKTYVELFRAESIDISFAEQAIVPAFREMSELTRTCAQQKQAFVAVKGIAVVYGLVARSDIDFIAHCTLKRQAQVRRSEVDYMRRRQKHDLKGYTPVVRLGKDLDLIQQAAAHIIESSRLTGVKVDILLQLFFSDSSFNPYQQKLLAAQPSAFYNSWKQIFTGVKDRIDGSKYLSVRDMITPLLILEKKNKMVPLPLTSGSLTFLQSTSMVGAPAPPAPPPQGKRKGPVQANISTFFISLSNPNKAQKTEGGGASAGTNPHERAAAAAASSSSAGAGAGAAAGAGAGI